MKIWSVPFILCLMSILVNPLKIIAQFPGETIEFERLDERSGSNASDIYRIYQDKTGFIWVCAANGLYRYDGKVFLPVKNEEGDPLGLGDDHVYSLFEDSASRLWAITEFGELYLYDRGRSNFFRFHIYYESGCNSEKIEQLIEGPSGQLYVISNSYGLCLFDLSHALLSPLSLKGTKVKKVFKAIADPVQKIIWVLSSDTLRAFREEKSVAGLRLVSAYAYAKATSTVTMEMDKEGNIWLGGWYPELAKLNVRTRNFELFKFTNENLGKDQLNHNRVNTICFDADGKVWAGTNASGVFILDPRTRGVTMIKHDEKNESSLSHNTVTKILSDKDGNVWISTWGNGLNKYTPARTQFGLLRSRPNLKNTLGSLLVSTFYEMDSNQLWIGSSDGLNLLNRKTGSIQFFKIPTQITKGQVCSIYAIQPAPGQSQTLWLGTSHGLLFFDPGKKVYSKWRASEASELPVEQDLVYFIDRSEDQGLHLLTYSPYTLFHYNLQTKRFVKDSIIEKTFRDPKLIAVFDRHHHLWMSADGKELYRYSLMTKQLKKIEYQYKNNQNLTFGIGHVHIDDKDRIWIGSRQGLLFLRPGPKTYVLEKLTERDGLPDRLVNGIISDDRGFLWISTMGGLSRLDPEKMVFRNYYASDGLQANEFSYNVCHKSIYSKKLMFGGTAGCNIFDPESIRDNVILPNTVITGINTVLNNTRLDKLLNARQREGSYEITTTHDEKVLHIDFSALHFVVPERNKYSYYLENFESGWNTPTSDNFATYTNLKAGSYRFMVKASNKDGRWNETPTVLWIRVLPPWWKTWYAYAAYIILILLFLGYIYLTQMKRQYQELEAKRLSELDHLKSRLYANITHEFRTPLTVILGLTEQLQHESKDRIAEGLGIIKRNGKNLLALINQMLDLAKLESGGVAVNYVQGDVVGFIEYSLESFQSLAHTKQISLDFLPRERPFVMDYDAVKLMQIVSNLVSNAIKFTREGGKVEVKIKVENERGEKALPGKQLCIIEVSDSGVGITEEHLAHVFDRFYQADMSNTRQNEGTGIGLSLSRELVILLGADITVQSTPGIGSVFTVKLPVHHEATRTSESIGLPHILDFEAEMPVDIRVEEPLFDQEFITPLILVIEDNADVRHYLTGILKKDYRVTEAVDGLQGIEKALDIIPDIIISDVMMPGKDGFEVCSTLKNDEKTSHVPIIMLTARAAIEDRITGIREGADAYIAKPFHKAELFAQIENLLESRKKLHGKFLQYEKPEQEKDNDHELDNQFLGKLNKIIEAGADHAELTIEDICVMMLMSRMQLHRKIKALTGLSTSIYIRNIRLIRAEYILKHESLNVSEVAYKVGFNDPKYFSRLFTEHFGYPPSDILQK